MPDYLLGLDLGQSSDPTALSVLKRSLLIDANGLPQRDHRGERLYQYVCSHLEQFRLGTSYTEIVAQVSALVHDPKVQPKPWLAIDATGVGRAVVDLFLNEPMPARVVPITITAGDTLRRSRWNRSMATGHWVPKSDLVSAVQAALQSQRFKVVSNLKFADTLRKELIDFRIKVTKSAKETFSARQGAHDDLVLSIAMPLWLGTRREFELDVDGGVDEKYLAHETTLERQAITRADAREQAERERRWYSVDNEALWP